MNSSHHICHCWGMAKSPTNAHEIDDGIHIGHQIENEKCDPTSLGI